MAKRKRTTTTKPKATFVSLRTSCGSVDQLEAHQYTEAHTSIEACRKDAADDLADCISDGSESGSYVVVQIVDVGKPAGMEWSGNGKL